MNVGDKEHTLRRGRSSRAAKQIPSLKSDFMVKYLPEKGRAVFAAKEFHRGDFLMTYDGELVTSDEGERREAVQETGFRYFFSWKGKKFCLDASDEPLDEPGLGRLVNHGWKGEINSKMRVVEGINSKPVLSLFAIKTILPNEEILYDYGLPASFKFPSPPPPPPKTLTSKYPEKHQESKDMVEGTCQDSNLLAVETESVPEGHDIHDSTYISSVSDRGPDRDIREDVIFESNQVESPPLQKSLSLSDTQLTKGSHNCQESEDKVERVFHDNEVLAAITDSLPSPVSTLSDRGADTSITEENDMPVPNPLEHPLPQDNLFSSDKQHTNDFYKGQEIEDKSQRASQGKKRLAVLTESLPEVYDILDSHHIPSVPPSPDREACTDIRENSLDTSAEPNPLEQEPPQESVCSSGTKSTYENHEDKEDENIQRACHENDLLALVRKSLSEAHEILGSSEIPSVSTLVGKGADPDIRQKSVISPPNPLEQPPQEKLSPSDKHFEENNNKCQEREDIVQNACFDTDQNVAVVREILNSSSITILDREKDSVVDSRKSISTNSESDCETVVPDSDDEESSGHHMGTNDMHLPELPIPCPSRNSPDAMTTAAIDDSEESDNNSESSDSEDDRDPDYVYEEDSSDENDESCNVGRPSLLVTPLSQNSVLKKGHKGSDDNTCEKLPSPAGTDSANVPSSSSGGEYKGKRKVYVMRTHNDGQNRCYDKVAFCLFCSKPQKKLQVHLLQHTDKVEVSQYLAETAQEKKNELLAKIRNRGNHMHNYNVLEEGKGGLVVVYRPKYEANPDDYQPCSLCLGWYARTEMWKHKCYIKQKNEDGAAKKRAHVVWSGRLLLPPAANTEPTDLLHKVLNGLRSDPIGMCIKHDDLILALGKQLSFKLAHDEENYNSIRCKLREVARLVLEYRTYSGKEDADLASLISPTEFDVVLQAVRNLTGFNSESHLFAVPSLARKLGHSLNKAANLLLSRAIKDEDPALEKKCRDFITLYEKDWGSEISSHALRTMYQQKRNNPKILPLTADVVTLSKYLRERAEADLEGLKSQATEDKIKSWRELNQVVLTHLIVFNRRRQGEVSKMTLTDYSQCKEGESHMVEGQMEMLDKWEQHIVKLLWRVEIVGKRGRTVPVLITKFAKSCIDALLQHRTEAGVNPMNTYLFPVPKVDVSSHLRGCDTLREHSKLCGAKQPALLRSTRLRKHIATMTQLMDLRDNELDVLASYMGHDIRIHRQFYRLPDAAQQVAKISKILFAMEGKGGNPTELLGNAKAIEDLQIHPDEELNIGESAEDASDGDSDDENMEGHEDVENMGPHGESLAQCNKENIDTLGDVEPERPTQKGQKRKRQDRGSNQPPAQKPKVCRMKWTDEEKSAVFRQLGVFVQNKKLPGKRDIDKCLEVERSLKNRSWKNIKDFVRNLLTVKERAARKQCF